MDEMQCPKEALNPQRRFCRCGGLRFATGERGRGSAYRAGRQVRRAACSFFFSSRRRHTRCLSDWSSDVCSSDLWGTSGTVVAAQHVEQTRGEHGVTVLAAFTLLDPDEAAFGIDIGGLEGDGFADAQAGAVADHEGGAVLEAGDVVEEG